MRLIQLSLILFLTFVAGATYGQYYMFDAEEDGVVFEYARGDEGDVTADGVGMTVKSGLHSGIYLAYAKATAPNGQEAKAYGFGYEHYVAPRTEAEFFPTAIATIGISNNDLPYDQSITALTTGVALGFLGRVGEIGRNVSSAGLVLSIPLSSSAGISPDVLVSAVFSSSLGVRLSQKFILIGGAAYSITVNQDTDNTFEFHVGLGFATKNVGSK